MANGLVVTDTSISVGGRSAAGSALGRVQGFQFTEDSDLTLTAFGSVVDADRIGDASVSIVIPAKGFFMLSVTGRILTDASSSASEENLMAGLRIGSTNYWATFNDNGSVKYFAQRFDLIANSEYAEINGWGTGLTANDAVGGVVHIGIEESGVPTGTQTVGLVVGVASAGAILKGGTTDSRAYLTVTDCT